MSKVYITKRFTFEACHRLSEYAGKCSNLHGHSYKLEVTVSGNVDKNKRFVMDFGDLKGLVYALIISSHDHNYLNNLYVEPTAEHMAVGIFNQIDKVIKDENRFNIGSETKLESVKLWETEDSYAEYRGELVNAVL